jgi:hypothetical protein
MLARKSDHVAQEPEGFGLVPDLQMSPRQVPEGFLPQLPLASRTG